MWPPEFGIESNIGPNAAKASAAAANASFRRQNDNRFTLPNMTIKHQFGGHIHDLGDGFTVRRLLPHIDARHVGPFVFFDHMGPVRFAPGRGIDVRPHPHIGLATVTYLFDGAIRHRDSLGSVQDIRPGDVNWMTAGRGIVHSERTPDTERAAGQSLHGIQIWVALPQSAEEVEPEFHHHPAATLPVIEGEGVHLRLVVGKALGKTSPVRVFAPMFYLAAEFSAGGRFVLPAEYAERAVYALEGDLSIGGATLAAGQMAVLSAGDEVEISAATSARAVFFGGAPLDGERHLYWNFVSSSRDRIEQAKQDWIAQRLGHVAGESEFIPLPAQK
jgi:redox-sensitive bicupin YhaK (pirin superfamily)